MLKNSALNSTLAVSVRRKRLFITMSACQKFGPCSELRTRLPNVPGDGMAKAAGLRNWRSLPRNGLTPGIRSGRRTLRDAPPPGVLITAVTIVVPAGHAVALATNVLLLPWKT